jgi:transglutaminase-like putative cysteine protease
MVHYQIPRSCLTWLLLAMFAGIAPHLLRLPSWMIVVCLLSGIWRLMVFRSRWQQPGMALRILLVAAGMTAVVAHFGTLAGPEAGVALLVLGFCFKLLEMQSRRDAFVVIILGYFVVGTEFFFSQGPGTSVYILGVSLLLTAALVGLNQSPLHCDPMRAAKQGARLLCQSLPLMVVLFILVPRVAPLWSLDLSESSAQTGISDRITPGDIANLSRSSALAFRVSFEQGVPAMNQLYWRGLILNHYDGKTWSRGKVNTDEVRRVNWNRSGGGVDKRLFEVKGAPLHYRIFQQPTDQSWLFTLAVADSQNAQIGRTQDYRLIKRGKINQLFSYDAWSYLDYRISTTLSPWERLESLQLPGAGDPLTRERATQWRLESADDRAYIQKVLNGFRSDPFIYTLRPPTLSGDRIDRFLFETRRGFCSHYAGAFVFMMRAAGIPARIVAGYLGGEYNELGEYLLVHQFDAHAWTEVWLQSEGWVRIDPTAAVSPDRVELGIEQALASERSFLDNSFFAAARYRAVPLIGRIRLALDYMNYRWNLMVVGYDEKRQSELLKNFVGDISLQKLGLLLVGAVLLSLLILIVLLLGGRTGKSRNPLVRRYLKFCRKMARRGMPRAPGESPVDYQMRLSGRWPHRAAELEALTQLYSKACYSRGNHDTSLREFDRLVRRM